MKNDTTILQKQQTQLAAIMGTSNGQLVAANVEGKFHTVDETVHASYEAQNKRYPIVSYNDALVGKIRYPNTFLLGVEVTSC